MWEPSVPIARTAARLRSASETAGSCAASTAMPPVSTVNSYALRDVTVAISITTPNAFNRPMMRIGGRLEPVSWSTALLTVPTKFDEVRSHNGKFAAVGSTRTNEENYCLQKFARQILGTNNIDHHRTGDVVSLLGPEREIGRPRNHGGSLRRQGCSCGGQ